MQSTSTLYMSNQKKCLPLQSQCNTFAVIGSCKFLYDIAGIFNISPTSRQKMIKKHLTN